LIRASQEIFNTGMPLISEPFLDLGSMLRVAPDLIRLQSYRSVYGYVSRFIQNDFLRRCFSFHPLLIGGNPFDASSLYVLIHHLERAWGVHYVRGGTGALVEGFGRLIRELGGEIQLNTQVQEIVVQNGKTTGVRLTNGEFHAADLVISNADVAWTYLHLVKPEHRRHNNNRRIQNLRYSMSLFVSYFGTKRQYRDTPLKHHNIILGKRYKQLLQEIFDGHTLPDDFSLYLHMPTLTDASIAPPGHDAFYVLSPVPNLQAKIDWSQRGKVYEEKILQFLEENYLPDLRANIVVKHHIDPRYFETRLNSYLGAGFSVQPLLLQSAWFRPHNRSEDISNLYFVGAGTHPGGGVPGVLSSAKLVANLIARDFPLVRTARPMQVQTSATT
jgi:phytoene desaturase